MSEVMTVSCKFGKAEYLALEKIANANGTQVHHLIEMLTRKALEARTQQASIRPTALNPRAHQKPTRPVLVRGESATKGKRVHRGIEGDNDVRRLHAAGLNDREVADELGLPYSTAGAVRRRLNLPPNARPGRPAKKAYTEGAAA